MLPCSLLLVPVSIALRCSQKTLFVNKRCKLGLLTFVLRVLRRFFAWRASAQVKSIDPSQKIALLLTAQPNPTGTSTCSRLMLSWLHSISTYSKMSSWASTSISPATRIAMRRCASIRASLAPRTGHSRVGHRRGTRFIGGEKFSEGSTCIRYGTGYGLDARRALRKSHHERARLRPLLNRVGAEVGGGVEV